MKLFLQNLLIALVVVAWIVVFGWLLNGTTSGDHAMGYIVATTLYVVLSIAGWSTLRQTTLR